MIGSPPICGVKRPCVAALIDARERVQLLHLVPLRGARRAVGGGRPGLPGRDLGGDPGRAVHAVQRDEVAAVVDDGERQREVLPARLFLTGGDQGERSLQRDHAWNLSWTRMALSLSVLDQSPISEGMTGSQALHNTLDLARLADALGYDALLGRRAPRRADARRPQPGGADRPDRVRHRADPGRQRRRDAPALQPVQGRRDLQRAGRPVSGPDRPRARPRGRHRPDDHARAAARPHAARCPTTSRSSSRSCWRTSRATCRCRARSRGWPRSCPGGRRCPSRGCSAPRRRAPCGRASSGCRTRSPTSSTRAGAEIAELYRREFREGVRLDAPRTVVAVWALAADSEEEAVRLATSSRMAFTMLRRGRLIAVPPPDTAVRFLESEGDGRRRAGARSSAPPSRCAPGSRRSPASTARRR